MLALVWAAAFSLQAQSVCGKWVTTNNKTGQNESVIEIFLSGGKLYGKIVKILVSGKENAVCEKCEGDDHNKPILGMQIIRGLKPDGDEYNGGKILDPMSGKFYKCKISLDGADKLKVRGYIGVSLAGRTETWKRYK
jgi:uncharacterized protein (DUF2147 family)